MGIREDVRHGRLNPEKAIEIVKRGPVSSEAALAWLKKNGRSRYEKGIEDNVRAEEAMKQEGKARRAQEE